MYSPSQPTANRNNVPYYPTNQQSFSAFLSQTQSPMLQTNNLQSPISNSKQPPKETLTNSNNPHQPPPTSIQDTPTNSNSQPKPQSLLENEENSTSIQDTVKPLKTDIP